MNLTTVRHHRPGQQFCVLTLKWWQSLCQRVANKLRDGWQSGFSAAAAADVAAAAAADVFIIIQQPNTPTHSHIEGSDESFQYIFIRGQRKNSWKVSSQFIVDLVDLAAHLWLRWHPLETRHRPEDNHRNQTVLFSCNGFKCICLEIWSLSDPF